MGVRPHLGLVGRGNVVIDKGDVKRPMKRALVSMPPLFRHLALGCEH